MSTAYFRITHPDEGESRPYAEPGWHGVVLHGGPNRPTASVFVSIFCLEPGAVLDLHYHDVEEVQYLLYGTAVVTDANGQETTVAPDYSVYCAAGERGAHGFRNNGSLPVGILCFFPSLHGAVPARYPARVRGTDR